jgi:hypothetical protein
VTVEEQLTRTLARWAALSVAVGVVTAVPPSTRRFGRQTAVWGLVCGVIAAVGARRHRSGGDAEPGRLRRVLLVNAGLDVGYLVAGAWLLRRPRWRGDGLAVLVQGAFLLSLDGSTAARLSPGRRP